MTLPPALAAAAAALAAGPAQAHGALPGGGGFYAGLAHPFLAWEHLLLLLALGLIFGRQPRRPGRAPLTGLALGLAAGLALGAAGVVSAAAPLAVLTAAGLTGLALALAPPLPIPALAAFATACGLAVGIDTGAPVPPEAGAIAAATPSAGVFVGVFLIVLNAIAIASLAHRPPWTIAVRIAGSWVAAAAVMVLALQLRRLGTPA